MTERIKLLIVEDHLAMIEGYKTILNTCSNVKFEYITATCLEDVNSILDIGVDFSLVILDISLKKAKRDDWNSGEEIGLLIRSSRPNAKIIVSTSHVEKLILYSIHKSLNPEGFLIKSDFSPFDLISIINKVLSSQTVLNESVSEAIREFNVKMPQFDWINQRILFLISQGIQSKNLPNYIKLSISAIDKRKAVIKESLGIQGSDQEIIIEARKRGII